MTKEAAQEVLKEYIKVAATLLQDEYGDDYTPNAVAQLADRLIAQDQQAAFEKEAALIRQYAFEQELSKNAGFQSFMKNVGESAVRHIGNTFNTSGSQVAAMTAKGGKAGALAGARRLRSAAIVGGTALGVGAAGAAAL